MLEFLQLAFSPAVVVFSILLVLVLVYWLIVAAGLIGTDVLDVDAGDGGDAGGEAGDAGQEALAAGGALHVMLAFFYVGRVPITVLVSVLVFCSWMAAVLINHSLNPQGLASPGLLLGLTSLGIGLVAVKVIGWPFAKLNGAINRNHGLRDVAGKVCTMLTPVGPGTVGQAEVQTGAAPVIVTVMTDAEKRLERGQEAVIVRRCAGRNAYLVSPVER